MILWNITEILPRILMNSGNICDTLFTVPQSGSA